ncbi:unnamed protein product [Allacma fusca]|uniref:Uncharacterized protein n=1 Tax=Allacma fusca TaxID=39272 RepID=A0A8J2KW73_9HEXA|nr:unnamed protein product [Allacma fusca]
MEILLVRLLSSGSYHSESSLFQILWHVPENPCQGPLGRRHTQRTSVTTRESGRRIFHPNLSLPLIGLSTPVTFSVLSSSL